MNNRMNKQFVFTITSGRSGTNFLAELFARNLPNAEVHHEQLGYRDWGVNSPEVSHLTQFNHEGNNAYVRAFWQQKTAIMRPRHHCGSRPPSCSS